MWRLLVAAWYTILTVYRSSPTTAKATALPVKSSLHTLSANKLKELEVTATDIRLLKQDEYLLLMEIVPDDEIMRGMFWYRKIYQRRFDGISYTYAAFVDDLIIGFVYGYVPPNKALLPQYLYVDPQYRKQELGGNFLQRLKANPGVLLQWHILKNH